MQEQNQEQIFSLSEINSGFMWAEVLIYLYSSKLKQLFYLQTIVIFHYFFIFLSDF